jgi:hypothetical protein
MNILLGYFGAKVIFQQTIWNENLHEIRNNKGVRVANFATSKNLIVRVRCSHITAFINLLGHLLMERHMT